MIQSIYGKINGVLSNFRENQEEDPWADKQGYLLGIHEGREGFDH